MNYPACKEFIPVEITNNTYYNGLDPDQDRHSLSSGPEVIKHFSCSTQLHEYEISTAHKN